VRFSTPCRRLHIAPSCHVRGNAAEREMGVYVTTHVSVRKPLGSQSDLSSGDFVSVVLALAFNIFFQGQRYEQRKRSI
jgi:hypothetical protein